MRENFINMINACVAALLLFMVLSMSVVPMNALANPMIHNSANLGENYGKWGTSEGGAAYGEFDCSTCHARDTGNIKRVKQKLVAPSGSFPIESYPTYNVMLLDVRKGSSDLGDDSSAGRLADGVTDTTSDKICEACHTQTKYHNFDATANTENRVHYNKQDCMTCHPHSQGFKPVDCTSCHGLPPVTNDNDGSTMTGLAHNPYNTGSVTAGAHNTHVNSAILNYTCETCHAGYKMPEEGLVANQGDISISFNSFGSPAGSYSGQSGVSYNQSYNGDGTLTCSAVYCHGSTISGGTDTTPVWNDTATATCGKCHPAAGGDVVNLDSGSSHDRHAKALGLDCSKCHGAGYSSGSAAPAGHVSGNVDWALDTADSRFSATAAYNTATSGDSGALAPTTAYGDCTNIYCHSSGQSSTGGALTGADYASPTWGGAISCGDCHATTTLASGSHNAHLTFTGTSIGCDRCHTGASAAGDSYSSTEHVDQTIDVAAGLTYSDGASHVPATGYGDCSTTVCHGNSTPTWGGGAMLCDNCHGANSSMPGSHGAHYNVATVALSGDLTAANNAVFGNYELSCGVCHDGATHVDGEVSGNQRAEVLFNSAIAGGSASYAPGGLAGDDNGMNFTAGTCSANKCHDDGLGGGPNTPPVWGGAAMGCNDCHDSKPADAVHARHVDYPSKPYNYDCSECHAVTTTDGTSINDHRQHVDGDKDVDWGAKNSDAPGYVDADTTCAVYCHSDGTRSSAPYSNVNLPPYPVWNSVPVDGCGKCHSSGASVVTNAHEMHAGFNQDKTGRQIDCSDCHSATATSLAGLTPEGYSTYHVNKEINVKFDSSLNLNGDNTSGPTYNSASAIGAAGSSVTPGTAVGDCSNLYCHSIGNLADVSGSGAVVTADGEDFKTVTWSTTGLDCADCHGDGTNVHPKYSNGGAGTTTANSHVKHVESANLACYVCHEATTTDAAIPPTTLLTSSSHLDRIETVSFNSAIVGGAASYDGTVTNKTCSTTYCHGGSTPQWGGASISCAGCHNAGNALANSHGSHYELAAGTVDGPSLTPANNSVAGSYVFSCGVCHDSITHAGGPVVGEQSAEVEFDATIVNSASLGTPTYTKGADSGLLDNGFSYTQGSCANTYCHSNGNGAAGTAPSWGSTTYLGTKCDACHGNNASADVVISTGAHTAHVNSSDHGASKACNTCHDATVDATDRVIADKSVHINGVKNVAILAAVDGGNSAYAGSCDAVYCHSTGQSTSDPNDATPTYVTATWGTPASGDCGTCHKVTEGTGLTSGSHGAHLGTAGVNGCGDCHAGAANNASSYNSATHVDQNMDVTGTYNAATAMGDGYGTCSAASCHDNGLGVIVETPHWGTTPANCTECHTTMTNNGPTNGSHAIHMTTTIGTNAMGCDSCHLGSPDAATDTMPGSNHLNTTIEVAEGYWTGPNKPKGSAYSTCTSAADGVVGLCHDNGRGVTVETPIWGTDVTDCSTCHAKRPATASHDMHLNSATLGTMTSAFTIGCGNCHGNAAEGTTAPTQHGDSNIDVYGSAAGDLGYPQDVAMHNDANYSSCSVTYCHGETLKYSEDAADVSPQWGASLGSNANNCDVCHGFPPVLDVATSDTHPASLATECTDCHLHVNAAGDGFDDLSKHIDGNIDVDGGDSCTDCHGAGKYKDPNTNEPDHADHTDVATFLSGKTLTDGDYGKEAEGWYSVTYNASGRLIAGCGQCHPQTQGSHPSGGAAEVDVDPAGETILAASNAKKNNTGTPSYSTGTGICSNVYCHGDGVVDGVYADSPVWDNTADNLTCGSCHGNSPTTAAHSLHEVGIHYDTLLDDDAVGLMAPGYNATLLTASGGTDAAHGNPLTSSTISCFTCHKDTVTDSANAGNETCANCHSDTGSIITGNKTARILASSSTHLDGDKDVSFAALDSFLSKAQIRDDIATVDSLKVSWIRMTGYKDVGGGSYDQYNAAVLPSFDGTDTCSNISCHNGESATWTDNNVSCYYCHKDLPQ